MKNTKEQFPGNLEATPRRIHRCALLPSIVLALATFGASAAPGDFEVPAQRTCCDAEDRRSAVPFGAVGVTNRSKTCGLWDVVFPVLRLQPIGGTPQSNFLALPRMRGTVTANPFGMPRLYFTPYGTKPDGLLWPGHLNMQFQAVYDQSGAGLYLGVHDGTGCKKQFDVVPSPGAQNS